MLRLLAPTTNGAFTLGKVYQIQGLSLQGTPVLKDDEGRLVDVWEKDSIPACWGQHNDAPRETMPTDKTIDVVGTAQTVIDLDPKDPQYVKKVQASIKRLVHAEKYFLLTRLLRYVKDSHKFGIEVIEKKIETHKKMMSMSDDEVITW